MGAGRIAALAIVLGLSQLVQAQQATGPGWIQLGPAHKTTGGPPAPAKRLLQSAVYDPATNRMIVFGGATQDFGNFGLYNDVWVLANADGTGGASAWVQLTPSGAPPAPRFGAGGVYDPGSNRLIIFGGLLRENANMFPPCNPAINTGDSNDVWVLTNANGLGGTPAWTRLSPAGEPPSERRSGVVVYDAASRRLIVFAGNEACAKESDTWVLTNADGLGGTPTWTRLTSPTFPPARGEIQYGGAYDAAHNRLIVFGGRGDLAVLNDTWVLSNANGLGGAPAWTQLRPAGALPPVREAHTVTYDAATDTLTVVGGADFSETRFFGDIWRLSNANGLGGQPAWTPLTTLSGASPLPRAGHSVVYHQEAGRVMLFSGAACNPCSGLNDAWVLAETGAVPFAAFSADVHINQASASFKAQGDFTLGAGGSIDPVTQGVTFQVGGFTATIPAGSFTGKQDGNAGIRFEFAGTINGVPLDVTIRPHPGGAKDGSDTASEPQQQSSPGGQADQSGQASPQPGGYAYTVDGAGALNLPAGNPVSVGLTIGNNVGSLQVTVKFDGASESAAPPPPSPAPPH